MPPAKGPFISATSTPRRISVDSDGEVAEGWRDRDWIGGLDHTTVEAVVQAGRARWKIENEHNNVLKTKGDHLEHTYGHGQHHLAAVLLTLHLLAFLFQTVLGWVDQKDQLVRQALAARQTFFQDLQALTRYLLFERWDHLLDFMLQGLEIARPPDPARISK